MENDENRCFKTAFQLLRGTNSTMYRQQCLNRNFKPKIFVLVLKMFTQGSIFRIFSLVYESEQKIPKFWNKVWNKVGTIFLIRFQV